IRELEAVVRQMQAERSREKESTTAPDAGAEAIPAPLNMPEMPGSGGPSEGSGSGSSEGSGFSGSGSGGGRSLAGWNDEKKEFFLRSADDKFKLRFTGQIQGDYRAFLQGEDRTDNDTFLVR